MNRTLKAGLAEVYRGKQPRYFNVKIYQDAEAEAKNEKGGMWRVQCNSHIMQKSIKAE
jgi:endonuclease YncB( thermonuclease family)